MFAPANVVWLQYSQILITTKEVFTWSVHSENLPHHWLLWEPAQQNVVKKRNRNLLDFYHEDEPSKRKKKKKIPYISTKSCHFVLYFEKRLLTGLSLSCPILMAAYLNLTTPVYRYCTWHSGNELFGWPWTDIGCVTVQTNNQKIRTTAGTESFVCKVFPLYSVKEFIF